MKKGLSKIVTTQNNGRGKVFNVVVIESEGSLSNWLIFKSGGDTPSRRAYHSSFIYQDL